LKLRRLRLNLVFSVIPGDRGLKPLTHLDDLLLALLCGFDCGGFGCYPAYCGVTKHPSKAGVVNPTHKTPRGGITPPLEAARLDHVCQVNAL